MDKLGQVSTFLQQTSQIFDEFNSIKDKFSKEANNLMGNFTTSAEKYGVTPDISVDVKVPDSLGSYLEGYLAQKGKMSCESNTYWSLNGETFNESAVAKMCSDNKHLYVSRRWRLLASMEDFERLYKETGKTLVNKDDLVFDWRLVTLCDSLPTSCSSKDFVSFGSPSQATPTKTTNSTPKTSTSGMKLMDLMKNLPV